MLLRAHDCLDTEGPFLVAAARTNAFQPETLDLEGPFELGEVRVSPARSDLARRSSTRQAPIAGGSASAAASRARYAKWSDADDRRKGRNPREQNIVAAGPEGAGKVLEFPLPDGVSQRLFLLHNFKVDGAALRPEHKQYLEGLAQWMRSRPRSDWQIFVEAHASRTGTEHHDDVLSQDRYLVTRAFLESQLLRAGIDAARLRIYGEGVGFQHSPLPGEDSRARSVYVVMQPNPSPFPRAVWPPPITPVPWPPVRPRPLPVPPPNVTVTDIFDYVPIDFVLEDLKLTVPSVFSKRPAFRDLASLTATPAGAMIAALKSGPHKDRPIKVDPADASKFQTRVRMQLAFPASTADPTRPAGSGKLPLAVLVHGHHNHYAVTPGGVLLEKESFRGYRYLQEELARAGIASISVDTNMANATGSFIELRADLVLEALKCLKRRAAVQGSILFNRFNFDRVALMGHSRGGDAVVRVVNKNRAAPAASRFGILTVCSLAPTDLTGGQVAANRMFLDQYDLEFYSVLYGALDGDVSGRGGSNSPGGTGFRHYDRARCQKALVFAERCCHNSFNSIWHADGVENGVRPADRASGKLVDEATHRKLAIEYIGTQFKAVLKGTASKTNLFNGTTPSATGLATAILWAFGNPMWIIDDFENPAGNLAKGTRRLNSGAALSDFGSIQIPAGTSINDHVLEQGHVVHADTAVASGSPSGIETTLPVGSRDITLSTTLALDVGAFFDTTSETTINAGTAPTFSVVLQDNKGATAAAAGSSFSPSLRKPFFHELSSGENVTALHLETLKIPLTTFTGIDLRNVVKIDVRVSPPSGHLFIDDIKLAGF
jgi:outer membrane protein OmpA-like peptidoglycan-associated protein